MIKVKVNNEYKDVVKIFGGSTLQKEIIKVWSREAQEYVYESEVEYTGSLPITITADGNALLDYRIYGNTVQDGTPTLEAPVDVVGCGVRTKNLCRNDFRQGGGYWYSDTGNRDQRCSQESLIPVEPETKYTMSWTNTSLRYAVQQYNNQDKDNTTNPPLYDSGWIIENGFSFTTKSYAHYIWLQASSPNYSYDIAPTDFLVSVVKGSTALPYEPYGYKLPILSNSTVTNIYLGEVETTRRIGKFDLSQATWRATGMPGLLLTTDIPNVKYTSSNLELGNGLAEKYQIHIGSGMSSAVNCIAIDRAQVSVNTGNDNIKPTGMFYYALATPKTAVVNEPLMKIGDYADTLSMEQADVSIPTFAGTTVIDYDGTPKPSEMYIKYRR